MLAPSLAPLSDLLTDQQALELATVAGSELRSWVCQAAQVRDRVWGRCLTYSPKVFLPVTNLCRDRCDYCGFRRSPGQVGEWTMSPRQILQTLDQAQEQGCIEALFCLGDQPDVFPVYRQTLAAWGWGDTVEYLIWAGEQAGERGLLPHTNAGILTEADMARLRRVNVSLGLMLESISPRLCDPGMAHAQAPDKRPELRVEMTRGAGRLQIPFTSGILVGIGETPQERVQTLLGIRRLHQAYGHIQEVIVQPLRCGSMTPRQDRQEPSLVDLIRTIALARLILPAEVSVQTPPNLSAEILPLLIQAGINDFGGISPVTPDYINRDHPWPQIETLGQICARSGFELKPRLPIYPRYYGQDGFLDPHLQQRVQVWQDRLRDHLPMPVTSIDATSRRGSRTQR